MPEVIAAKETFQEISNLPKVVGAIDGTHIRIPAPPVNAVDYFSRYQQHDIVVQAVVVGRKRFMDVSAGYPGGMHDARVLRNSLLFRRCENNEIMQAPVMNVEPYLVGDSAYPLACWLQKGYPEGTNDPDEIAFNEELSAAREAVECAFGILKSRWRILRTQIGSDVALVSDIVIACAVRHIFCISVGDEWEIEDYGNDADDGSAAQIMTMF